MTRHIDRLYRAAWSLCGSREDAEDLVQETFARVLAKPRTLRGDDELSYLMRVLRNTFLTTRRTTKRRPVTSATLEEVVVVDRQPMGRPDEALDVHGLYEAISSLPEDFRLALVAVDMLGLSYREAARVLGAREATITTRLFRARRQVVDALEAPAPDEAPARAEAPQRRGGAAAPRGSSRREGAGPAGSLAKQGTQ
ncbi:MAG: RNA polymerase sigma factor [Solirubrobacterales bacterium]|nr:RNA polymerase sigma factor [Solirubrobacterales bacterium]